MKCWLLVFPPTVNITSAKADGIVSQVIGLSGKNGKSTIVTHTAVVEQIVTVGPDLSKIRVAVIQSFCVLQDYRSTGLSDKMMSVAMKEGSKRNLGAGLLFCRKPLEKLYSGMG